VTDSEILKELRDRARRTETRLTKYMEAQGFNTETAKCAWVPCRDPDEAYISIPSRQCALQDILAVIPPDVPESQLVAVYCKGDRITEVRPCRQLQLPT
jgi:hypothetical protein